MNRERRQQINQLLEETRSLSGEQRAAYLDKACAGDSRLREEVESLLEARPLKVPQIEPPAAAPSESNPQAKAGQRFGPYEVLSPLGKGGMGEVFLAQDTRLGRKVALKLLPAGIADDAEAKRRFTQEARTASSLNHPNIITIYDIGTDAGREFIAMEYIEGDSLRNLQRGRRDDLNRTLELMAQAAAGLAAAHEAGITHRDIKPDNLMVTRNGQLKILDFGLAKLSEKQLATLLGSDMPTAALPAATKTGMILGTVAYMSPEQASGRSLDHRTDIFSLGVVLYEMLAGQRPFQGDSAVDVLHAIINTEPRNVLEANPRLPASLTDILSKALAKELVERYQHAGDFELDLRRLKRGRAINATVTAEPPLLTKARRKAGVLKLAAVGLLMMVAGLLGWWFGSSRQVPSNLGSLAKTTLLPLTSDPGYEGEPTFSPDGETIAYVSDRTGNFEIYIQQISGGSYRNITENPADDVQPAYSPDGKQIAFVSSRSSATKLRYDGYDLPLMGGDIWVIPALGGNARKVAEGGNFPSWSRDGSALLFTAGPAFQQKIYRVDAQGGEPREIVPRLDTGAGVPRFLLHPRYSADERWIVFEADSPSVLGMRDIWVVRTDNGEVQHIAKGQYPSWNGDAIIYSSAEAGKEFSLWQTPFSTEEGKVTGQAMPLTVGRGRDAQAAVSRDRRQIAFTGIDLTFNLEALALDAETGRISGSPEQLTSGRQVSYFQDFSPDAKAVVFESRHGNSTHLWKLTRGGVSVQLTAAADYEDTFPRWSPDGRQIAFNRLAANQPQAVTGLWLMADDGANPRMLVEKSGNYAWLPDGRGLVFFSLVDRQLYVFDLQSKQARRLTNEPQVVQLIAVSPDGGWTVYQTLQSGNIDLRAVPLAGGPARTVVATPQQDYHPTFSPSGRWLYFQPDHKNLYRVPGPAQGWRKAEPEKVTDFPESGVFLEDPVFARNGKQLLYARRRLIGDIWIMNLGR